MKIPLIFFVLEAEAIDVTESPVKTLTGFLKQNSNEIYDRWSGNINCRF